jgi:hypothetical protein
MPFGKRQPSGYHGFERRRQTREKVDFSAYVVLSSGQLVRCRLIDYSSGEHAFPSPPPSRCPMHLNCAVSVGPATRVLCTVAPAQWAWNSSD